ncbi:MAG: DUF1554 domain-containing protein [Spirochaetia bacterium]|nr:DUF1554 domain-containing protein [Spirochaetia bacterium]
MRRKFKIMRVVSFVCIASLVAVISCSKPFPEGEFLTLLLFRTTTDANKYIFVTQGTHNGNFAAGFANGIAGADSMCAQEKAANFSSLPGASSDYKALIVDGANRQASATANLGDSQIDWVLKANTSYYLSDQTLLMTTNATSIFVFGTLLAQPATSGVSWWTGMDLNWATGLACTGSVWASTGGSASRGLPGVTGTTAIGSAAGQLCTSTFRLLCVRQ